MTAADPGSPWPFEASPPAAQWDALGEAQPAPHAAAPASASGVAAWLATALPAAPAADPIAAPPPAMLAGLGQRLAARVAASAQASRPMQTVRPRHAAAGAWLALAPGVRALPLHTQGAGASLLLALDPGATLPLAALPATLQPGPGGSQEWLLLSGRVTLAGLALAPEDYLLRAGLAGPAGPESTRPEHPSVLECHGPAPSWVYLQAWPAGAGLVAAPASPLRVAAGPEGWQPLRAGVAIKPLSMGAQGGSLLARFEPGGRVPAHPHGVGETCLMLTGELFLGDVLLREGDFQFAPAGSQHGELFADQPCLLFFHGAIDPASVDVAYRAERGWPS